VWGIWALFFLIFLAALGPWGSRIPSIDEWHWVPVLTGQQPLTWQGLWARWAEHRIVLARFTLWVLDRVLGYNLWAGAVVNICTMAGIAWFLIRSSQQVRGSISYSDAFLAIVLVRFFPLFTCGWVIHNTQWTALAAAFLFIINSHRLPFGLGTTLLAGILLFIYPLTGAMGLAMVPALALWLAGSVIYAWRAGKREGKRLWATMLIGICLALAALSWVPFYFRGLSVGQGLAPALGNRFGTTLAGALAFLATGLGPAAGDLWPYSGAMVAGLLIAGLGVGLTVWIRKPEERFRLAGLFLFMCAVSSLAVGTAWGRGSLGVRACLAHRYGSMSVIAWCGLYLLAGVDPRLPAGRWLQFGLLAVACALLPFNTENAVRTIRRVRSAEAALENDVRAGMPPRILMERYQWLLLPNWNGVINPWNRYFVTIGMQALRKANFGAFAHLRDEPASYSLAIPSQPATLHDMRWRKDTGQVTGAAPWAEFSWQSRHHVYAIMAVMSAERADQDARVANLRISWRTSADPKEHNEWITLQPGAGQKKAMWINDMIDSFRIEPGPEIKELGVSQIELMIRPQEQQPVGR
jgi:hypothetical protein